MFFKNLFVYIPLFCLLISSCGSNNKKSKDNFSLNTIPLKHANRFEILKTSDGFVLKVNNPWQGAQNAVFTYKLSRNYSDSTIHIPVNKVICLSTTHIGYLKSINRINSICGISGGKLASDSIVRMKVDDNRIIDVGYDQNIDYESIINLAPEVIFAYGVESSGYVNKLYEMGFNVVYIADYLEQHPLAKTEWIKFFSCFFDCADSAITIFDSINNNYNVLKMLAQSESSKPVVLTAMPWKESWYIPGGKSYLSQLIGDAGGKYLWENDSHNESMPVSIEVVLEKSDSVDIWINTDAANSLADIARFDSRLTNIRAWKNKMVFNNSLKLNSTGGNDYWESGVVRPDAILGDLIFIFHPGLLKTHTFEYYHKLN